MKEILELLKENKVDLTLSFKYAGKLHIALESTESDMVHGKAQAKHLMPIGELNEPEKAVIEVVRRLIENLNALKS